MYFNKHSDEMIENHKMTSKTVQIKEIPYQNVSQANDRKVQGDIGRLNSKTLMENAISPVYLSMV